MRYLIRDDGSEFRNAASIVNDDGIVGYTNGMTVAEYIEENGPHRVVEEDELMAMVEARHDDMTTGPASISLDDYNYALEVLPPCRWHTVAGFSVFHMSERITGPMVDWYVKRGNRHWHFVDRDHISDEALAKKLQTALAGQQATQG